MTGGGGVEAHGGVIPSYSVFKVVMWTGSCVGRYVK